MNGTIAQLAAAALNVSLFLPMMWGSFPYKPANLIAIPRSSYCWNYLTLLRHLFGGPENKDRPEFLWNALRR